MRYEQQRTISRSRNHQWRFHLILVYLLDARPSVFFEIRVVSFELINKFKYKTTKLREKKGEKSEGIDTKLASD